jgi:hypothetical protein
MLAAARRMAAGKGGDFVTIAAKRHGAPASAARARVIIEKEPTRRVGADAQVGTWAFRDEFGGRTRNGCEKPVQTAFAGDELETPFTVLLEEFVVAFGDAQDFVDRFDPIAGKSFFAEQCPKDLTESSVKPLGLAKEGSGTLRIILRKSEEFGAPF